MIYYYYGIRLPKTIIGMVFWGPNSIIAVYMDPLGTVFHFAAQELRVIKNSQAPLVIAGVGDRVWV